MTWIHHIGRYFLMLREVFSKPEKFSIYWRQFVLEVDKVGVQSVPIVGLISLFMGAVITIQTAAQIEGGWYPESIVGFTTRQSTILEFSPTIIPVILAGKVGSNIASEIGTMRITEQIDALDIMGVNSTGYLVLPKIVAAVFIFPFLIVISMFLGITAGALICDLGGIVSSESYQEGIQLDFDAYQIQYALIKTTVFAFVITSISAYCGYHVRGGALEVGKASTQAVVWSIVVVMTLNVVLTQLLL